VMNMTVSESVDFFKEEFPDAKLQIQKITLVPVN